MVPSSKLRLDLEDRKQLCRKNKGLLDTSCFLLELTVLRLNQLVIQRQYMGEACILHIPCVALMLLLPWLQCRGGFPFITPKNNVGNSEPVTVTSRPRNIRWSVRGLGHHTSDTTHHAHDLTRLEQWSNFSNSLITVIFLRVTVVLDGFP